MWFETKLSHYILKVARPTSSSAFVPIKAFEESPSITFLCWIVCWSAYPDWKFLRPIRNQVRLLYVERMNHIPRKDCQCGQKPECLQPRHVYERFLELPARLLAETLHLL